MWQPSLRAIGNLKTHQNSHGFRGVEWEAAKQRYRAAVYVAGKRTWLGSFATAAAAARAYDAKVREIYGGKAGVNFPLPGERSIRASRLLYGECPYGHSLSFDGYIDPKGRVNCRRCNLVAVSEYKARARI